MKAPTLTSLLGLAGAVAAQDLENKTYPTTMLAGMPVINTQIVQDARALMAGFPEPVYAHVMRSWLFGVAMYEQNATLKAMIDPEVHAMGTLLHDLGWDMSHDSPWFTTDHRFEVDGAIGSRKFIRNNTEGKDWSEERVQLVWDAISLHGTTSISDYKQPDVSHIVNSILIDYAGPMGLISNDTYHTINSMYDPADLLAATNETFIWFCETKPVVTYENWVQGWGMNFVEGYSAKGHLTVDMYLSYPPSDTSSGSDPLASSK
ncbi:hypothetical protein GGR56DRAFT_664432 [Xylariaceae sp. FL0804]|nr:hypothetical protein GGR56DRAFT_664432 [Xylariaceae sp. FL0804]